MMRKTMIPVFILSFFFISCVEFLARVDHQRDWERLDSDAVCLYYRPEGFSEAVSPTLQQAEQIINNQRYYYEAIQDSLHCSYSEKILIYLYNQDEAKERIGTNGGGHALPKYNTFYYTFITSGRRQFTDSYGFETPPVGAHEMVHVISHRMLGYPETRMLSEGYAVWLDGFYAGYSIDTLMIVYRDAAPEKILTPNELLHESIREESIYYPNCGLFIRYLVENYGIDAVNRLFVSTENNFVNDFELICADNWDSLAVAYANYIHNLKCP